MGGPGDSGEGSLTGIQKATVVQDREGDSYERFCLLREHAMDFVIGVSHDRRVRDDNKNDGEGGSLDAVVNRLSAVCEYETGVENRKKHRTKRTALLEVRYGNVAIRSPKNKKASDKEQYPGELELSIVPVQEKEERVPQGEEAVEWRWYTSHRVEDIPQAPGVIERYTMLEDVFRRVKPEGLN